MRRTPRSFLERRRQIDAGVPERRRQPEENSSEQRKRERKSQDGRVDCSEPLDPQMHWVCRPHSH